MIEYETPQFTHPYNPGMFNAMASAWYQYALKASYGYQFAHIAAYYLFHARKEGNLL
jgi:hypothetical protein